MNTIALEQQLLTLGRLLSETLKSKKHIASLNEVEFKVFSQWGDDGIIQWLVNNLEIPNKTFIEFGVENYRESNTRFLMMNDNWSGLVMDGSESNVAQIINSEYFWKYELSAKAVFVDKENINTILSSSGFDKEVGILHIDVDGNDYWIWKEIDVISPIIVIMEYNSIFGIDRAITIPYDKEFFRTNAHHSNLYFGASLRAFYQLSIEKGYSFIGCNSAGNNAYFVRKDKLTYVVQETSLENGYVASKFRQSRDKEGYLTYLSWNDSIAAIKGMPIYNVDTNQIESLFELAQSEKSFFSQSQMLTNQPKPYYVKSNLSIIVDGVFFQLYATGIARVWRSLLEQWAKTDFGQYLIVLDRANTAPKIDGVRYRDVPLFSYDNVDIDRQMLQQVCDEEGADLFISSYYTRPITTPSVFMGHDMIPEVLKYDFSDPMWQQKHNAINHASAYITISENTADDLVRFFPGISKDSISVAHCGVNDLFSPATGEEIDTLKSKYGITKPYFLLVGVGYLNSYKNSALFLQAYQYLDNKEDFDIVITGFRGELSEYESYTSGGVIHGLSLSDQELAIAYSGALALVYPSKYEGFGMPVLEAMACGCPVITCPNSSLPEVAGEAAIYVNDNDIEGMINAIYEIQKPSIRQSLITAGLAQATKFSWAKMAKIVSAALLNASLLSLDINENNLIIFPDWSLSRDFLTLHIEQMIKLAGANSHSQTTTLLIAANGSNKNDPKAILSDAVLNLSRGEDIAIFEGLKILLVSNLYDIQWKHLLARTEKYSTI